MPVVTRTEYFQTALQILANDGFSGLNIGELCQRLGVTSGSFYHHFGNWDGFVEVLLEYWETDQTNRILELSKTPSDPLERIETMKLLALAVPHEAEAAIRAWSKNHEPVAVIQRRVDHERQQALEEIVAGVVADKGQVRMLATLGISILVGVQQLRTPVDVAELNELLDEFQRLILLHAEAPQHQ